MIDPAAGPGYPRSARMLEAFQRGDVPTLGTVIDGLVGEVWRLGRTGFSIEEGGQTLTVDPDEDHDRLEHGVILVLAQLFDPHARSAIESQDAIKERGIQLARAHFAQVARARGDVLPGPAPTGHSFEEAHLAHDAEEKLAAILARLDERARYVVEHRFRGGQSALEVASAIGCGRAAVISAEGRARRAVARALRGKKRLGPATVDAVLTGRVVAEDPAPITVERIRRRVLSRTTITPALGFGRRLAEGLAFATFAGLLWALMYVGVLPGPDGDPSRQARVEIDCKVPCTAGSQGSVLVQAPAPNRKIALWIVGENGSRPLLAGPNGGSLSLPMGARDRSVPMPWSATFDAPLLASEHVVAVLSEGRLTAPEQRAALTRPHPKVQVIAAEVR